MLLKVYNTNSPLALTHPPLNPSNSPKQQVIWNLQIIVLTKHVCKILNLNNVEYTTDCVVLQ